MLPKHVLAIVGPMHSSVYARLFGRFSAIRRACRDSGHEHLIPAPPPADEDPTMTREVRRLAHRVDRRMRRSEGYSAQRVPRAARADKGSAGTDHAPRQSDLEAGL